MLEVDSSYYVVDLARPTYLTYFVDVINILLITCVEFLCYEI